MALTVVRTKKDLRAARHALDGTVGFVPTMGALHEGHLSLIRLAREHADHVIASIFVNPTQFGPNEDLAQYPRDVEGDVAKCQAAGCDLIFAPAPNEMYADGHGQRTEVRVDSMARHLCGASRPVHFAGVATVVSKLFNVVQPDVAVFGEKDYQQLALIRCLTRELEFPVEIVGGPIVREPDGLAMSSRNLLLKSEHREEAVVLSQALLHAWSLWERGERSVERLVAGARETIGRSAHARIDYVECVDPISVEPQPLDSVVDEHAGAVMAVAVYFGNVRLIDNLRLDRSRPIDIPSQ